MSGCAIANRMAFWVCIDIGKHWEELNIPCWLFYLYKMQQMQTKTPSFRWKFNKTQRGKWLREISACLPFFSPCRSHFALVRLCYMNGYLVTIHNVCVWFIKLLSVIYATFVHAIITGVSEYFLLLLLFPPSSLVLSALRGWLFFLQLSPFSSFRLTDWRCVPIYHPESIRLAMVWVDYVTRLKMGN